MGVRCCLNGGVPHVSDAILRGMESWRRMRRRDELNGYDYFINVVFGDSACQR